MEPSLQFAKNTPFLLGTMSESDNISSDSMSGTTVKPQMTKESTGLRLRLFGRTDVGQIREHNEDNFLVANLSTGARGLMEDNRVLELGEAGVVLGVCDGMGGAAAGEVASQLAVDLIYEQMTSGGPARSRDELARRMVQAIEHAGSHIFQEARSDRSRRGMGTTSTIAAFLDNRVFVGQVGDSRAYLLRQGTLCQLSRDQSLVNQLIEAGQLTEEEAETFEHNNIILQALGTAETVQVDLTYVDLFKGDVLMMCSDGLSGMIRSDEIREVLLNAKEPIDACRELTDRANTAGGHDNITVIVVRFDEGLDEPDPSAPFGYQKYALPDITPEAGEVESTKAASTKEPATYDTLESGDVSEEAKREDRELRVSHTMVGMTNPMADTPVSTETPPGLEKKASAERGRKPNSPSRNKEREGRNDRFSEEPVALPTTGFPPSLMAIIVICAMLLAGLFGYLLIK
jgi:protein phosphatase